MPFAIRTRADDADKHASDVNALIYAKDKLYSGGDDGKIKIWEEDLRLVKQVAAHERSIFSLVASNDTLYSCSNDGTVKAWALDDLSAKGTIFTGEGEIWKLWFSDSALYIGDNEGNVRVYADGKIVSTVNLLEPVKDMMVIGNLIYTVKDLDLVISEVYPGDKGTFGTTKTIMGRAPVCVSGDKLCFCSRTGKDLLLHENSRDLQFKELSQVKDAHEMIINALCGVKSDGDSLFYSGGWDKTVKQWKVAGSGLQKVNSCCVDMCINVIAAGPKGEIYVAGSDGHIVRVDV